MEYTNNKERLLLSEAERIGYEALMEVTGKYGFGDEEADTLQPPSVQPLAYHNARHTLRVRNATRELAARQGLSHYDTELAVMIASAHDVYHDKEAGPSDEEKSAVWLMERMRPAGFTPEDMEIAHQAILGTQPLLDATGAFRGQQFTLTEFLSERARDVALCIAAADLEALFAPHGPLVAHDLLKERLGVTSVDEPATLEGAVAFQHQQLELLSTYHPLYPELEQIFGGLRQEILDHHAGLLDDIKSGAVTTWKEIVVRDCEFAERYATRRTF